MDRDIIVLSFVLNNFLIMLNFCKQCKSCKSTIQINAYSQNTLLCLVFQSPNYQFFIIQFKIILPADNCKSFHTAPLQSQLPKSPRHLLMLRLERNVPLQMDRLKKNPYYFSDSSHKLTFLKNCQQFLETERISKRFCDVKDEISACGGTICSKNTRLPRLWH